MRISLCMIVKNEAQYLARCLESVQGLVHEIWIADTGSEDTTPEIARAFTPHVWQIPWQDDFAWARNQAMAQASGDWILVLDADEWLPDDARQTWPQMLADPLFEGPAVLNAQFGPPDAATVFKRVLFRNHQGLSFAGRVHEKLVLPDHAPHYFDCFPLRVWHEPQSAEQAQTKARWYLHLIQEEFKAPGLSWARQAELWQHRADAYESLGEFDKVLPALQSAWQCYEQSLLPQTDLFGTFLLSRLILAEFQAASKRVHGHIQTLLKRAPDRFEGWFFQAYDLLMQGQSQAGMPALKEALLRRQHLQPLWQFRLDLLLARYSLLQGAAPQGEDILLRLLSLSPQPELVWHLLRASLLTGAALTSETDRLWQSLGEPKPVQLRQQAQRLLRAGLWSPEEQRSLVRLGKGFKG